MQTSPMHSATARQLRAAMPIIRAEEFDDERRYAYTKGWDDDDADLGWIDLDVVERPQRLH